MGRGSPQNQQQHHGRDLLDPFLIAILGILSGALVVAAYHCIGANISLRRRQLEESSSHRQATQRNANLHLPDQPNLVETGWMFVYGKDCDGKRYCEEGTCAVCLGEYEDGEVIRALPGCLHAFHAACIDTWLNSHSSCPLCRGLIEPPPHAAIMRDGSGEVEANGGEGREGS